MGVCRLGPRLLCRSCRLFVWLRALGPLPCEHRWPFVLSITSVGAVILRRTSIRCWALASSPSQRTKQCLVRSYRGHACYLSDPVIRNRASFSHCQGSKRQMDADLLCSTTRVCFHHRYNRRRRSLSDTFLEQSGDEPARS